MNRLQLVSLLLVACLVLLCGLPAHAQGYRPKRPTMSPWLDLGRTDSGPLDPYHNFVRPKIQLRETLQQHDRAIRQQSAGIRSLGQQFSQFERGAAVRPTGTGSSYMFFSHYYRMGGGSGSGNRR